MSDHDDELCAYCGDYSKFCGHDLTNVKPDGTPVRVRNKWNAELFDEDEDTPQPGNYWDDFVWVVESKGKELIEFPTKEEAMASLPRFTWDHWSSDDGIEVYKVAWSSGRPAKNPDNYPIIRSKRKGS